ncbi:MAG: MarR family transcriptional regulator [Pseudomonadota bacterium]
MDTKRLENLLGVLSVHVTDQIANGTLDALPEGLSAPVAAITFIGHNPGATIAELGIGLSLSHPGAVRLVDRLSAAGMVERRTSEEDGRAVALWLTQQGETSYGDALSRRAGGISGLIAVLRPDECATLENLAEKLLRHAYSGHHHALRICRLCDDVACDPCPIEAEHDAQLVRLNAALTNAPTD